MLESCGPTAFDGLVKALRETGQEHVADALTETTENQPLETSQNSRLSDGNNILLYSVLRSAQLPFMNTSCVERVSK